MKISLNVVGKSNDKNNFRHKLLLTNTQFSKLRKAFTNGSSADIKLSKTKLYKTEQLLLIGNVLKPLAKSVLITLGLTAAASATDAAIHKKMFGSGVATLMILNEEMKHITKIVKSLEESGLLMKGVSKRAKRRISRNVIKHFRC